MTTAVYIRVSTDKQTTESQELAIHRYVSSKGLAGVRQYRDEGVSGTKWSRPEWNRLLEDIEAGEITRLVVWKLDRIGRPGTVIDLAEKFLLLARLCEKGVELVQIEGGPVKCGTFIDCIITFMLLAFAGIERENIATRTRAGMAAAEERGSAIGRPESLDQDEKREAKSLRELGWSYARIGVALGVSRETARRACEDQGG